MAVKREILVPQLKLAHWSRTLGLRHFRATIAVIGFAVLLFGMTPMAHAQNSSPAGSNVPSFGLIVDGHEMVMPPLSQITATTPIGTITITAGEGFKRCYTWEGATGCVTLDPEKVRWKGIYGAGSGGFPPQWHEHHGITRAVVGEDQLHFRTIDDFFAWFKPYQISMPLVYRDDGLVVDWQKSPGREQLNVDVWQVYLGAEESTTLGPVRSLPEGWPVYVGGQKPTKLPGSQDDKIQVRMVSALPHDDLSKWFYLF